MGNNQFFKRGGVKCQTEERQIQYDLTSMWNLKTKQNNRTHRCREQTGSCQKSWGWESGESGQKVNFQL